MLDPAKADAEWEIHMDNPTLEEVRAASRAIEPYLNLTPVLAWRAAGLQAQLPDTEVVLKLELFQQSGSFKARGALVNMLGLDDAARARGVTAVSAGNHAIAVAWAASALGIDAKVVMQSSANPARVDRARAFGAEVIIGGDGPACFALVEKIVAEEGRTFVHPFEGKATAIGTGTLGLEMVEQMGALDMVILPIGGGGLAGGVSTIIKALHPETRIIGVEPEGADTMHRSFAEGAPQTIARVATIADSLGPPMALPYSFGLCHAHVDELVMVDDDAICRAMLLMFNDLKLAVEPAAAVTTAAMIEPLKDQLRGKRVGMVVCGTNIDPTSHAKFLQRALEQ
ncbi:MAG: threonine/serine dehydratase [Sphingomonadales bacterium]